MAVVSPSSPPGDVKPLPRRVLVCLDRSAFSEVALTYAISIAQTFGSEVTLTHVLQPRHDPFGPQTTDALGWEIARQEARAYLEQHAHGASEILGRTIENRLEQGHPAERIVGLAHEVDADLIVLGSHGEGGVTPWNLGSTVQQVLSVTRRSVLVARPGSVLPSADGPQAVLVPLDGSVRPESVLPTAARIATAYHGELILAHVVPEPIASAILREGDDLELAREVARRQEKNAGSYLESVRDRFVHEAPSVRTMVLRHINERQCLLELAQREHAGLIVLSAHGSACDPARSFGSVSAYLLTHSVVPLLVMQDLPHEHDRPRDLGEQLAPPMRASFPPEAV